MSNDTSPAFVEPYPGWADENKGPLILTVTGTLTGVTGLFVVGRIYSRLISQGRLAIDDYIIIICIVSARSITQQQRQCVTDRTTVSQYRLCDSRILRNQVWWRATSVNTPTRLRPEGDLLYSGLLCAGRPVVYHSEACRRHPAGQDPRPKPTAQNHHVDYLDPLRHALDRYACHQLCPVQSPVGTVERADREVLEQKDHSRLCHGPGYLLSAFRLILGRVSDNCAFKASTELEEEAGLVGCVGLRLLVGIDGT